VSPSRSGKSPLLQRGMRALQALALCNEAANGFNTDRSGGADEVCLGAKLLFAGSLASCGNCLRIIRELYSLNSPAISASALLGAAETKQ
jgi:hypothetical protein